jgi:hypothetical protein
MAARWLHLNSREGAPGAVGRASGQLASRSLAGVEQASVRQSLDPWPLPRRRSASQPATTARATACSTTSTQTVASPLLGQLLGVLVSHRDRPQRSHPPLLDV